MLAAKKPMRDKRERDPLHAARKRLEAAENALFLAHLEKCSEAAVLLARDRDRRLGEAIERGGRVAVEAAWRAWKTRGIFAQFFATEALAHTKCIRKSCRRAKRCAYGGLSCLKGYALLPQEEYRGKLALARFLGCMTGPESESERALGRRS